MARLGLRTESEPIILRIRLGPGCGRKASERALTATMVTALPGKRCRASRASYSMRTVPPSLPSPRRLLIRRPKARGASPTTLTPSWKDDLSRGRPRCVCGSSSHQPA